ncbi:polysaccharide deacetylase family protein [Magnetospira sp. QH-2]|uniref:polysaccharide deacetylase family protein n=1 Tax=Magnetospira sp. (strain QH-2) TaxID=1288970 RepID=UPI0003E80BB5|nr:polysaccharide deacetylase family protein [Magnetospira sp. QH-2]CCQ75699.1 putative CE4 : Polysaccharide deacetylase [Magnetospira sp. QH-2]
MMILRFLILWVLIGIGVQARAADSASILLYHRFAENDLPSTSVRLEQLDAHINTLRETGAQVLPLAQIVEAFEKDIPLPDRAVALSVDDAFLSAYTIAWPRWRDAGYSFTLFVATEAVDRKLPGYMTWDQIRELRDAGVTIGSQTTSHPHLPQVSDKKLAEELAYSNRRFKEELGHRPNLIAYPYGEAGVREWRAAKAAGFKAGFGQHSGVAHGAEDRFYLPRFSLNEQYGDVARVKLVSGARPIPVTDWSPADPVLTNTNPPPFGFTLTDPKIKGDRLSCYMSHGIQPVVSLLGNSRVEIRSPDPLPAGRTRLNCTLPGREGRWHWVGRQFFAK